MDENLLYDLFSSLGDDVRIKRMFGGQGIFCDELMLAIVVDGELKLKVDEETRADFEAAGCRQWSYLRQGRPVPMSFYSAPESALDDPDDMAIWAERAFGAARRKASASGKHRIKRRSSRPQSNE